MIIAANLKTNLTREKTSKYIKEVESFLAKNNISQEVLVFPAISSLNLHVGALTVGTQNAYPAINGAFTGEIGYEQLEEFGIKTILIGHSERRHVIGETQEELIEKFNFYKELGFKILYCVGEPLEVREAGFDKMMEYISNQYEGIDTSYENLVIAYEPVWAIGTGLTPTLEDIVAIHKELKKISSAPLLYGGSVKVTNAEEVLALDGVDGVLVGSAALYAEHFCTMCEYAQNIDK
ncbi:MAG: triose-phosphate isomerase [Sulfurimonas sp. RIFOXYD12_FULL_33_39]|uniref:triose-phosphate isomerase n=1 Tax=unclassified Sulfurimonas TaxID=2623549 RepID=UPI0008B397F8|nr:MULTISPECIES: triose-phosphate isomerase [unclassified Sulfurimonas]OHE05036.1 MAG: triose-phosphate isomerase [Sulfurimonas sp. RIFCSPLOWO2_12_FULL_34_6]OHE09631.1 MAG: triose-phosphate isomerase [Sulfurimonas sp. RIFOXYD12_FULL_33_39]OHE13862.1 MAG: triose-phosphate isomerase [Sulfurimonas sp. RIFOXYD2_FULL_34_21]DAB27662.1 MAG TPA: triose-phosphate isomerase [Sulfurimonas sp. UBA10385]